MAGPKTLQTTDLSEVTIAGLIFKVTALAISAVNGTTFRLYVNRASGYMRFIHILFS